MDQFKKKRLPLLIAGAGGKKSSGSSRTPVEADDTVNSRTMASILDLLGEGVVGGLIDGAKSIFVDGVALQNEDGSFNRSGVTWDFRDGSQDQSPMPGFDFVETPKAVNTQLKTTNAVTVAIDNDDADRVRVIMKFPSLRNIDKKTGDTNGTSVQFKFQLANGNGSFYDVIAAGESSSDVTLTAKKTGVYYRSYEIQLPKPGRAYKVRVLRLSADSNDQYLFNDTWVDSIGEIVDTPMNYPNSVLVGLKVNSEQFGSSMPSRSYLIRGLKIRVPSNYDENTNTYNGVWDGTFKLLSSSNPAWILFDLLTNARYGLGKFVSESMIDLGQLYQIGRYCDEEVDDGFGGKEKRFAINTQITSRQDAYRLIQDIAGAFRGMVFWAGGMVNIMQDSPSDPVMLFTNANVKDGLFTYKGSARKDRPSVALITYNNKQDGYKQNVEYVEDQEAMARYGERKTEAVAFGCTSRGQAHRVGLWLLYTARMESDMITFTSGLDASFLMPGETVLIQNKYRAGKRNSGRIVSFTKNSITLDAPVSLKKSGSFIRIINQEGKIVERDINETGDNITKVTFKTALATADQPVANGVWTITEPDLVPMRARVVAIAQGETPGSFDITVVQNNASKYQAIDNGAALVPENTTVLDPTYSKPSNLVISEGTYLSSPGNLSVKLMLAWEGKSPEYWVSWRRSDEGNVSNWQSVRATEEQYEIVNVAENGRYDFQLYSVSFGGKKSEIITAVYQVKGTMTPPGAPTSLTAVGDYRNVVLNWVNPDSVDLAQINVYASKTNKLDTATLIAQAATTTFTHAGLGDNETWYYWIRAVNKRGMVGQPNSNLGTEATTRDVLSFLKDKITSSELGKELLDEIDSKATQEAVDNAIGEVQNSVNESIQQVENDLAQTSSEIKAQVDSVNQSLKENIDTVNQTIVDNIDTVNQTINTNISNVNSQIEAAKQSIKDGDDALSQEIKKAQSSLTTSLSQTSKDLTAAIQKETNDRIADVNDAAKQAADQLLSAKNELKTSIDSLSEVVTSGDENLARQISQIAAGTGEQFDSLKIWYFDQDAEGWTEDDNGYTPMSVTSDGWLKANNPTSTCRSPNGLTIDAHAYRFIKMRIKKVGNPTWNAKMFWIGADETGWNAGRSVVINEPEYDDKGIAILTLHDIEWRDSTTIRRFRFDFTSGQDADNYLLFDWIAVGRPTPGAGMAALQEEQQARANADTAEAQARSTLAAQIRGSSESGNLDDIRSGLIYQEKNARITADAAEASARESLQTEFNRNKASVAEELHTLSTEQASQASKITGLQTSLGQKADASAVQTISQKVEEQGNTLKSQGAALSTLDNRVGSVESGVSANSKAITGLQSTVTQQDKTLSSQSESITTLNNSLSDIQSDTDTAKSNPSNLLVNASFERDLAGWSAGNSVSSIIKASAPHSGSKILVCAAGTVQITQSVSVVEGRTYKLSSFVRCTTDAVISSPGNNKLRIGAATLLKEIPIRPENLPKDETWKEVSDTWKATLTGKVDVSIMSSLKTGSQYFDDVGFVDVTDALAIEANASATNALTSRVSSVEGTITSQGQQITSMQNSIKNKADASAVTNLTNRVTAAENQISSQSQSITSLSNSLDNANADADASKAIIGNMLKNNSFERGFEGWEYVGWTLLEAQNPKSGKYIIQAGKLASGGDSGCNQTVELQAGKTYRIGAWVRKSADFAINNAGNNKISLRNTDLTPLKDIPITGAGLSTNWALISGEYTPAKTAGVVVSLRASVASGYMYLDDVFCVDVSNEKAIDATANALSTLNSTVTQQGKDITSNSNSITSLSNQMVNGRQNMWVRSVYNVQLANNATEPTFSDINGKAPISIDEVPDAAKLDFASAGSYVIAHYKAFVKVNADTTITMAPGSRVFDDTGAVYVNGVRAAFGNSSWNTVSFDLKAGWSTVEFLVNQWTGQAYINLGFKLSEKVAQLNSALGMNALSNAISAVTSNVSTVGDRVTSTSQSVTDLRNSLEQTNANLANKADAQALSTLQNTVSKQGDTISSQGNSITKLTNDLATTNNNVSKKADQSALSVLSGRVDQTESGLSSANSSITALNSSVRAGNATSGDLISNPTFDPEFSQMGFTVVSSSSEGVPANCPYAYVARIAARDHHPNFAAIPATLGDVYEMSALVACGTGSADFNLYLGTATRPSGSVGAPLSSGGNRKASATWQRVTWRFKITQGIVDRGFFRPFLQINQSSPFGTVWYVTDWHLRNVTDSSKVQDSLDATAKAVDSLTSTVNQQGENISSIGTRTTNLENNLRTTNANVAQKADANALTALTNRVTQTEKDINSTSSSVTNLNNKVDAISVGGTNLIKNSGDMTGWSNVVSDTYRGNAVISATVKAGSGYKDLREITLESPVDAGEYVYSFYAKGGVAGQTMTAFFYNPNTTTSIETSQGAKGNNTDGRAQFTLTTSWARYWVKWKQTPTTGTKRLILCRIESNTSKDQTVYINSPKFEVGNVVSDWNESPSDSASASAVDSLTTKVNQQGTSISSIGNRTTSLENGLSTAQNNIAKKADASALQDLRNTVTSQGGDLTAANSSITSLQASMNRRTVFTVTARGNGNSVTPGVFDESGKNLFTPGRSWALVTFAKHSDGSTVIATSKTYDVFGSANNGATMSADIEALASGTYVCVLTFDEPSGNRGKVLSALESLGGTSEVVNSLPYRGAYILLGRKGMKPGDGLELRAPTGGDGTAHISTSVEFVNGVMMGLGAAGGVMMKADANASAITTLQNTVKNQGDNIDSLSSSTTALENSLASSNASVDAASQIPGNLIVNPSFERGTEGYTGWSGIATVVTLQVPHLGTKAAKLAAGGSAGVGQKISFKKDRSYKIGIWAKQDPNTTIQSTDNTKFRVAEGNGLIASKAYGPFTSNWQEVSWTWKATKDVVADVQFTAFLSAGAMYFDDFYVVDVTDSVETQANSSAITKLDSRVTKTENDITSQGSQVTQLKNDLATTNTNVSKKADAAALTALTNRVTQNEKEIETQSSQTTSLKNSLSTVQAMGSNPWFDGSLETYSENQQISGSRAVVVSSQKRSGTKSLRVSRGAGEGGNSDKSIGKWIALRENAVFRIELWAMMPADQSPSSGWSTIVGLQTQNAANNNNWPSAITITEGSLGGRGTWKKFTGTLRVATGHTRGVFWISTRGATGAGTPGYDLYIDDVVVTDITDAKEAQDSANANASALTSLTSRVTNVEGLVTSQASQLSSLTSQVNDASSKVDQMAQTITNNEKTQSSLNTSLQSQIDAQASANIKNQTELNNATTSLAAIKSTQQTQATTISALSQQQTNLTAQVGGQSAELQELKKTVVENGNVSSTWMVKMETNSNGKKYAAGIALGIDGKNLQSQFLVQADRFGLINTSNGNTTTPFVVENGVAYMNAAVIKDGSITNAKIGGEIRSDNFVNGSNGWRIGKDGSSQFNNVVIRGEVHANTGVLNNVTINENCTVLGTVQANKIVGDVVTMTDRVVKNWPASGNTSSGTRYLIATIDGMPFERRMVFNGSVAIVQVWRQNVTIRVDETTVWTFDSGNDGKDFETSIFSIRIPASNFGQRHQITIQWPNRGDSGQFRFTGVVSMYRTTGSISLA
ncbi:phage tail tip fiber protein [Klebsiella oxytoca]|uniref:phage tail tip fiber protein n=1 Tax=Klebsiella oxytoca TaxID=571 RepID=UPI00224510F6|nr:phage tail protein [Klebsiella oxytoca]MCW9666526.1 phage tail protein [Klebsiella oxytoca]